MSKKKGAAKHSQKARLESRVEQVHPDFVDTLDQDVLEYVDQFFHSFSSMAPLPRTSLLTPEGARQALKILDKKQAEINAHLRTAQALKKLLEAQQSSDGPSGEQ